VDAEQVRLEREKKLMQKVFGRAKAAGTIPAWDGFLQQFPSGPLADEARRERQKLDFARREKEAFDLAKAADTIPAWNEFLRQFPSGPLADEARRERQKLGAVYLGEWRAKWVIGGRDSRERLGRPLHWSVQIFRAEGRTERVA